MFSWYRKKAKGGCETCGVDLSNVLAFNKAFRGFKVLNKQIFSNISSAQLSGQVAMSAQVKVKGLINITTVTAQSSGSIYDYDINPNSEIHEFCSNKCVCEFALKNKFVFIFEDSENQFQKRVITPETEISNKQLGNLSASYRSLFLHKTVADHILLSNTILTERLILRDVEKLDIDGLWEIYKDEETMTSFDPDVVKQNLDKKSVSESITKNFIDSNNYYWVVTPKDSTKLILGFCYVVNNASGIHIEYAIAPDFRNRGIMTEALAAVLADFKKERMEEINALSEVSNHASHRVLTKLGFAPSMQPVLSRSGGISLKMTYKLKF